MWLDRIAPNTFLCRFELRTGSLFYGILLTSAMVICTITMIVDTVNLIKNTECSKTVTSYRITAGVYCLFMLCVHLWLIWGVKKEKASVFLGWTVLTAMWLAQVCCLLLVQICLNVNDGAVLAWLIVAAVVLMIPFYGILVVHGYKLEVIRDKKTQRHETETI
ncbi:uncharacterized protein LOC101736575 isoform X1 [Bombyx mori]|uniref:Uncharacterized protein n=2 Tax=Bombyx mori TaxID=7091 RepID=A0A8R2C6Y7_BOMMO|nr:uncharacterized protein LOC101736575 isoform X1 [Bombyx mori]